MNLPNRPINAIELENARREFYKSIGRRYTKLTKFELLNTLVKHNQQFSAKKETA